MAKRTFKIDQLIINSPYEEPSEYWSYNRTHRWFERKEGRRPAGYVVATPGSKAFDDPGVFVELPLVNQIRPRVKAWCEAGYPGVTGITKRLLEHWRDPNERRDRRFFFCQLEAIETLIWLAEASPAERQGIDIPDDGGLFRRLCSKMATGSGKTIVMTMLIAWQVLNKVTYPQDKVLPGFPGWKSVGPNGPQGRVETAISVVFRRSVGHNERSFRSRLQPSAVPGSAANVTPVTSSG